MSVAYAGYQANGELKELRHIVSAQRVQLDALNAQLQTSTTPRTNNDGATANSENVGESG